MPQELELGAFDPYASLVGRRVAAIDPPERCADAWLLGRVHEALLGSVERQAAGAHYTSREIASGSDRVGFRRWGAAVQEDQDL